MDQSRRLLGRERSTWEKDRKVPMGCLSACRQHESTLNCEHLSGFQLWVHDAVQVERNSGHILWVAR
ncbi:hypothetical protein Mp_7g07820 [Marchantia polymorpha subsp. ruderalis]|uniref:Uncharacterized protein n=2 Tax=Marchantia polymorpha TaxID=3197 RepID=A0AAF6BX78_MARPO|nr:hypothetical protein MARPO_0076s0012 [Marchantia polymorpha]BBN16612.1 hypothetical protein Mp_7g07820 [Marchantia polymorpha subsp. ruderalis]|eukprot:PTQ34765.1 hypothetical protein MARPO_0076s0012 [Marchantia polymorpha]